MTDRPLITFALFTYNQQQFIREAIQGAFAQTYTPLEIILSDDCSCDLTFSIMEEMAAAYSGPHTIILNRNESNLGLVPHVNKVLYTLAQGELIVMAAGDDISFAERTTSLYEAWHDHDGEVVLLMSEYAQIDVNSHILQEYSNRFTFHGVETRTLANIVKIRDVVGASIMINRILIDRFEPLNSLIEDRSLFFRAMLIGKIFYHPSALVKYRQHESVSYTSDFKKEIKTAFEWNKSCYKQLLVDMSDNDINLCSEEKKIIISRVADILTERNLLEEMIDKGIFLRFLLWVDGKKKIKLFRIWLFLFKGVLPSCLANKYEYLMKKLSSKLKKIS